MRHNVTTPGGFFIGLGGIIASLIVAYLVFWAVKKPTASEDLLPQQIGLKYAVDPQDPTKAGEIKRNTDALLAAAADKYNGGKKPDINELEQLRGVVRYQKARESAEASAAILNAPSSVMGPDHKPISVLEAAKLAVLDDLKAKKPAPSTAKVDLNAPAQVIMSAQQLPNLQGGGAHTVTFPAIKPAAPLSPNGGTEPK